MTGLKKALAGLMAVVIIPVTALQGIETVLCLAEDGHMAIEMALNGQCVSGPSISAKTTADPLSGAVDSHSASHCGPCRDIPLGAAPAIVAPGASSKQTQANSPVIKAGLAHPAVVSHLVFGLKNPSSFRPPSPPGTSPSRTLVLRN